MSNQRKGLVTYLIFTFALSSVFYYLIIRTGTLQGNRIYILGAMWSPGVAALLTRLLGQRNLRGIGWGWGKTRYQVASYLLPLAYAAPVYFLVWLFTWGALDLSVPQEFAARLGPSSLSLVPAILVFLIVAATLGVAGSCLSALGEEIGWRGFLVPELAKSTTFTRTALISGAIWSLWHYPLLLFADYRGPGTPVWYSLLCFTLMVLGISIAFAWLRLKSGSVWTGMFMHATHNLFIQGVFDALTRDTGPTPWLIGEFGAGLAVTGALVGLFFWRKRNELDPVTT